MRKPEYSCACGFCTTEEGSYDRGHIDMLIDKLIERVVAVSMIKQVNPGPIEYVELLAGGKVTVQFAR